MKSSRKRVLFVDTQNSVRSPMAEALLRKMAGDRFETHSAGTEPARVHPLAVEVMREVGIDISGHAAKPIDVFRDEPFDFAIAVCLPESEQVPMVDHANERLRWTVDDPTSTPGDERERLRAFRTVRDSLQQRLRIFMTVALRE